MEIHGLENGKSTLPTADCSQPSSSAEKLGCSITSPSAVPQDQGEVLRGPEAVMIVTPPARVGSTDSSPPQEAPRVFSPCLMGRNEGRRSGAAGVATFSPQQNELPFWESKWN